MYLFGLGIILGIGLTLMIRSIGKTLQLRRIRKTHEVELEIQRRVAERTKGWGYVEPTDTDPRRRGGIARPAPAGPAGW